eukprot:CAMPEP_0170499080 /NCGR_PEP_ID=MMETSP0208-20121228/29997_1 /TAXON_ID=197538 /ORGANISM="Strombidium inclinatum, Strain S3" /LENGTH=123 /DNA_ID=CAMNT_0010776483 /DNA_START=3854 /DNA_END=4226 /DNA_ORIENTATION=-
MSLKEGYLVFPAPALPLLSEDPPHFDSSIGFVAFHFSTSAKRRLFDNLASTNNCTRAGGLNEVDPVFAEVVALRNEVSLALSGRQLLLLELALVTPTGPPFLNDERDLVGFFPSSAPSSSSEC